MASDHPSAPQVRPVPTTHIAVRAPTRPPRLSEEIAHLVEELGERRVCLREVVAILRGRAYTLLLILLALPFCSPIPLPGLSTPFGLVIALIGFRLSLRQAPWLPRRLLDTAIPPRLFGAVLSAGRRLLRLLEVFLRPRWSFLVDKGVTQHACGVMILVSGLLLLLPVPVPFTNLLPALTVVLVAAALMERDGASLILSLAVFTITLAVFVGLFWGGAEFVGWIKDHFAGIFQPDYELDP